MSLALAEPVLAAEPRQPPPPVAPKHVPLREAIQTACDRIAPLWPLSSFVAVNPFLGFATTPFEQAARDLHRLTGAPLVMPRAFYREAFRAGRISEADLDAALAASPGLALTREDCLKALTVDAAPRRGGRVATVADVLDALSDGDRQVSRTAFMVDEISKWCAAYFDEGQAAWPAPWRDMGLFEAWRWSVRFDHNARVMGVKGLAATVSALPADPIDAIAAVLDGLEIPQDQWTDYLYRALFDVRGWAAYARRLDWEARLAGQPEGRLTEFLAIRLVWGYALFRQRSDAIFLAAWRQALSSARAKPSVGDDDFAVDLVLQRAYELRFQSGVIARLAEGWSRPDATRPDLQAVFCIDVRSEVYRRALETVWPAAETLGFAGFFGMPFVYHEHGETGHAHCPVLLRPSFEVRSDKPPGGATAKSLKPFWTALKQSAVSCFGFVEAFGLIYGVKLAASTLGGGTEKAAPATAPLHVAGISRDERVRLAQSALRGMSLVDGFARVVLLVGHGSTSVNNPHAAGLDCGACGGHSGAPNARFAAVLLNDPDVRRDLADKGLRIPEDTVFVAALHDTTTDVVTILDEAAVPATHAEDLARTRDKLQQASELARAERAPLLGLSPLDGEKVFARGQDWSQVRPEWGLARAAAFIAAPRALTAGRDLEGRAFLHSYDRSADPDLKILELILTAPMVVASWISLQYYGSTVANGVFGAGDKTLHNVCGRVGVLEGNGGDLRVGLALQSVHDGAGFVHEPLRLSVFLAAAPEAISEVLARQPEVQALLDNGWLLVFSIDDTGRATHRYAGALDWEAL
jgi:uncharacterized protein YbcC (UPF0753/DUF2309 family)